MLSILGALLGILTGAIPELLKFFTQKRDQTHEREMFKLQLEAQAQGHRERVEEMNVEADIKSEEGAYAYASKSTDPVPELSYTTHMVANVFIAVANMIIAICNVVIHLLNGLVRPLVTFAMVGFYGAVKYGLYLSLTKATTDAYSPFYAGLSNIWTETDHAVFATVIGHWFGQRMMKYAINGK